MSEPIFIRYTPSQAQADERHNSGAKQRIIRVQDMPVDPLEPPKFKHTKAPRSGGSPPVPVLHSPPRKLTAVDQQNWKIPPCVSNWKNIKGFTVPLDKRLVADGRGLAETKVNSAFAKLSEALYTAEQIARQEIEERAKMTQKQNIRRKLAREQELKEMAARAHQEKQAAAMDEDEDDKDKREERDAVRRDVQRELKREQRMERMKEEKRNQIKKLRNDDDRDVSEKIALGHVPQMTKDGMFDQRLFNQAQGMSSGFGGDDSYDLYDKPLLNPNTSTYIYRGSSNADSDVYGNAGGAGSNDTEEGLSKIIAKSAQPDRGFKGAESSGRPGGRSKPVEFERESDPFGADKLFAQAKSAGDDKSDDRNRDVRGGGRPNALDAIGRRGQMSASGGSSHGQEYSHRHQDKRMDFEESAEKFQSTSRKDDRDGDDERDRKCSRRS